MSPGKKATPKKTVAKKKTVKTAKKKTVAKSSVASAKGGKKVVHHKESRKHVSPWWVFWTYLFGILFLGVIVGGAYTYHNPDIIKKIDNRIGASIIEDNVEKFCDNQLFGDKNTGELFEVNGFVCQAGSLIPTQIIYDSECPECFPTTIENTLKLLMPTSVITKIDARAQGAGIPVSSLPYVVIDKKAEGTRIMEALGEKMHDVGEKYLLNTNAIVNTPRTVLVDLGLDGVPVKGDKEAPITITEFVGTECPACAAFTQDTWGKIKSELIEKDLVRYTSKILPIGEEEENVKHIANAMLCANDQGKYFEYLAEFYLFSGEIDTDVLVEMAETIRLGGTEFKVCLDEKRFDKTTASFITDLRKLEINTIPSYIIGDRIYTGPLSFEAIEKIVNSELQKGIAGEVGTENMNDEPTLGTGELEIQVYTDFDCTQCRLDWQMLQEAIQGLEDQVEITFSNLPDVTHAYAEIAAVAGECAVAQNNFWEYMNLMYGNQGDLRKQTLERFGIQIGFAGDFTVCVRASETLPEIYHDIEAAKLAGIEKTPTYIVGGEVIEAPDSVDGWRTLINEKL